ncbi:DNA methyltransferase [Candidatus Accumulibacter sp. ACC012]|uniref:DNA methyltransferase n=1 Tax=Candidatus Accumulibacter sp. ACC012 TaxID=2823332 RepID=UPI00342BBD03
MNDLLHNQKGTAATSVECFGQTFPSDQARREHFVGLLREKLKDPAFRKTEGFPIGSDEAILAMSDPPYYTACPNPFLEEFVRHYGKPYDPSVKYSREPQTIDVSVGKMDPLYKAHSYHTKVPHLAIVPSILHYTEPGDIVLDGFSGSGMTGIAAQWCGSAPAAYRHEVEQDWKKQGKATPKWGSRRVILNDLSPAATFIAANYNLPLDVEAFAKAGKQLLKEVEQDIGWMYETLHKDGRTKGRIEYTVWSEIFTCPDCAGEVNFLNEAYDADNQHVRNKFPCPHCGAELSKDKMDRVLESRIDPSNGDSWKRVKFQPAIIVYKVAGSRHDKHPDHADLDALCRIKALELPTKIPTARFPIEQMYHGSRIAPKGFSKIHHFFLPRAAQALGLMWAKANSEQDLRVRGMLLYFVEQAIWNMSVCNSYRPAGFSQVSQYMKGVYYVPSQHAELSPWYVLGGKLKRLAKAFEPTRWKDADAAISTGSIGDLPVADASIDYIFTDPPFGENILALCRFVWNGRWFWRFEGAAMSRADAVRAQPNPLHRCPLAYASSGPRKAVCRPRHGGQ